ncbi:MAG: recombinase family protein [Candidatus Omnitrophica bacterium]|nr:recombinase family protein [Candidatus Omnitrophota bacterium]
MKNKPEVKEKQIIRCAIYTRVSSAEGLEQEFTSLDNQRESAESYINSQKSEGWIALPDRYADGGFTGANTDRPALQKLIADIKEHKIDCVVVYKVDRLSRSLLDFSQLLEFFDQNKVAFVSVTQHFNTNTSMGRLTLNILLSFAQFEREIISERTRDKIGAAKRKGKWVGGCVPLGYNLNKETHKLLINPDEAKIVKEIFDLYLKERSLLGTAKILNGTGYRTKIRKLAEGKQRGGVKFSSTSLEKTLKNVYYLGKIRYQGALYQGEHERIISDEIFQKVQDTLSSNVFGSRTHHPIGRKTGLLTQILRCRACNSSMYVAHSVRNGKFRYCHYICLNASKRGYHECPTKLVNANLIEQKIMNYLRRLTDDPRIRQEKWETRALDDKRAILMEIVKEITYHGGEGQLEITLKDSPKIYKFKVTKDELKYNNRVLPKDRLIKEEPQLRQNLLLAYQIQGIINRRKAKNLKQVSKWLNISPQRINQIMNLLFLSPHIQEEMILKNKPELFQIPEYKLRPITEEVDWGKQYAMWQDLMTEAAKNPS